MKGKEELLLGLIQAIGCLHNSIKEELGLKLKGGYNYEYLYLMYNKLLQENQDLPEMMKVIQLVSV